MFERSKTVQNQIAIDTGGAVIMAFFFPKAARIKRYFMLPTLAAQAAHATIVVEGVFMNKSTDGSGSTTLATFTNDSDTADGIATQSGAWVRYDALEIDTENRPGSPTNAQNEADEIAAGSAIIVTITGAGTTPTANQFVAGMEYVESD